MEKYVKNTYKSLTSYHENRESKSSILRVYYQYWILGRSILRACIAAHVMCLHSTVPVTYQHWEVTTFILCVYGARVDKVGL